MKEKFHIARVRSKIAHDDFSQVDVGVGVDDVVAAKADADVIVLTIDIGDQRLAKISQHALPAVGLDPTEFAVNPHAEAKRRPAVVLLSDVRKVNVRQAVLGIECDDERTVADQQIAGH